MNRLNHALQTLAELYQINRLCVDNLSQRPMALCQRDLMASWLLGNDALGIVAPWRLRR